MRRAFDRAAATYDAAAVLQREVGARMAERLDFVKVAPALILDAGCGTGEALGELRIRYPCARLVALDFAFDGGGRPRLGAARPTLLLACCRRVRSRARAPVRLRRPRCAAAAGRAFDLVWSNLALQWVNAPRGFEELHRVLEVGGLLSFTTLGPDTLRELRTAFAAQTPRPTSTASSICTIWAICWSTPASPIR